MHIVNGVELNNNQKFVYMTQQIDEFRAICDARSKAQRMSPLTEKYFNRLYELMAKEEAAKGVQSNICVQQKPRAILRTELHGA